MDSIRNMTVRILGDTSGFERSMTGVKGSSDEAGLSFSKLTGAMAAGTLIAGTVESAFDSVKNVVGGVIEKTDELASSTLDLQRQTGMTAEQASGLLAVFDRFNIDGAGVSKDLGLFAKQIVAAGQAAAGTTTIFSQLGLSVKDSTGNLKDTQSVLLEVADKFAAMPDGVQKTADAMKLFGRSGKDLIPILDLGSAGIDELEQHAAKMGVTLSQDNVDAVRKNMMAQKDLQEALAGVQLTIGTKLMPYITQLSETLVAFVGSDQFKAYMNDLGEVMNNRVIPALNGLWSVLKVVSDNGKNLGLIIAGIILVLAPWLLLVGAIGTAIGHWKDITNTLKDATDDVKKKFDDFQKTLDKHKDTINEIVGVLTVLFVPALIKVGAQAIVTAVQMTVSAVASGASWAASAIVTGAAWTLEFASMVAKAIATSIIFAAQAAIGGYAWIIQAAMAAGAWLLAFPSMIAESTLVGLSFAKNAVLAGASWVLAFGSMIVESGLAAGASIVAATEMGIAWLFALGPIGLILAGIAAIAAGAYLIISNWGAVKSFFGSIGAFVLNAIGSFGSLLYNAGRDLVQGLINGVTSMVGAIGGAIKNAATGAVNTMKSILGIHSPSTVFQEIGQNIGAGLTKGIDGTNMDVTAAVTNLTAPTVAVAQNATQQVTSATPTNQQAPISVTIAPNIGIYAGLPAERRNIAVQLWQDLVKQARAQGVQLPNINVAGIQ